MSVASELGIEAEYRDAWGELRSAPEATVARLVEALNRYSPAGAARAADMAAAGHRCCFRPDWLEHDRLWGVSVQLYGVRSPRNWGIGDFTDLKRLIVLAASAGAHFIGVNPLHALFAAEPQRFSPYSPSSREFLNVLYIDPAAMAVYAIAPDARRHVATADFQQRLTGLRDAALVDYAEIAALKDVAFRRIFAEFRALIAAQPDHPLALAFTRFRLDRGEFLQRFAIYQALSCTPGFGPHWMSWPVEFHDPTGAGVRDFAEANDAEILYHAFLQWEADTQLAACATAARDAEMRIGLYLDVAVGTDPGSAEGWSDQKRLIPGFHIGAPPDLWNEAGQDWGLGAYNPLLLASDGGDAYRRMLAAVMRHAGAIRIDHVLGFSRLFLVASTGKALEGVYLRMPAHILCRALAEESVARRCIVVGEDLGTVPEGFQGLLALYGVLSYRLLIFAKEDGRFLAPGEYPPEALVAVSTHDLPPFLGFWSGDDIAVRSSLDLNADSDSRQLALDERAIDRREMQAAFLAAGFPADADPATLMAAAHGFIARSPCRLLLVQMEDLAMESAQPNLPGSDERHPNWRRKLGRDLDTIFADARAQAVIAAIRAERPNGPGR